MIKNQTQITSTYFKSKHMHAYLTVDQNSKLYINETAKCLYMYCIGGG